LTKAIPAMLLLCIPFISLRAQLNICPPNLDFEQGNFNFWECKVGSCSGAGGVNVVNWSGTGPQPGRHDIIPSTNTSVDPYGGFPIVCPNGSGYSVRLGNPGTGSQAEGLFYTYTIPTTVTKFSIFYWYAVVLQDPNHPPFQQPRFQARIVDVSNNQPINCVSFDIVSTAGLPGFQLSPAGAQVWYKNWTPITIDLTAYKGSTIRIEFITEDCTQGGHFGYAYVDVSSGCNGAIGGTTVCSGDSAANLTAPYGFQNYQWYSDGSFSTPIGGSQNVTISPAPPAGQIYPVIVTPYPSYGCVDTLYAAITTGPKPPSFAGPDATTCQFQSVQLGGPATPLYGYTWSPANMVNDPHLPNPIATVTTPYPMAFIVKTIDSVSTCYSYDTVVITPYTVDTVLSVLGKTNYCIGETFNTSFLVNPAVTTTQWFLNSNPIAGATSNVYQPVASGSYWARVTQNGCTDTTNSMVFTIHPLPVANFRANKDTQCITNNSFLFTNLSTVSDGSFINYLWTFSDATTFSTPDVTKTFSSVGSFNVRLLATTIHGCADSMQKTVITMTSGIPDFNWNSFCTNKAGSFANLSNENGAPSAAYLWDFGNGQTSTQKNPPPMTFSAGGEYNVKLSIATFGCSTEPTSISKKITVYKASTAMRYPDITVAEGYSRYIDARRDIGENYSWQPQTQLSKYNENFPLFTAVNDVKYFIAITDKNNCVTVDTLQIFVLKKEGYYLPTAFTPNGDGLNDLLKPYLVGMKSLKSFTIYNRYGNRIYQSTKDGQGWDGKFNGEKQPAAVYVWVLEFIDNDNKLVTAKGTVTLIR
jgi:gliding motility-associated-like protein